MKRLISALAAILLAVGCLCLPVSAGSRAHAVRLYGSREGLCASADFLAHAVRPCAPAAAPAVSAGCAVLMDADTGELLYARHPDTTGLIASTTKIMTAYLACQAGDLDRTVTIPAEAVGVEGTSLYLKEGETLTREELLYGAMVQSGNDAALALAIDVGGDEAAFVERMNDAARRLGLQNTSYANPHGLDSEGNYSTARDLALLTAKALENPDFRRICATKSVAVSGQRVLTNHNKLLWRCPGCIGVKTGYTKAAGRLLVSAAQREGRTLICVTVNDPADWKDHIALLDWGFERYEARTVAVKGELLTTTPLGAPLLADADLTLSLALGEEPRLVFCPGLSSNLLSGAAAGTVKVFLNGKPVGEVPVVWGENN